MNTKLIQLEKLLDGQSRATNFSQEQLSMYPESFRHIHSYNLFGEDLLAIPANLLIKGDDDEFEKPFHFIDNIEAITISESEFGAEILGGFVQIGGLYGSAEIVLLNKEKETIHIFHVSDIVDTDWIKYKLQEPVCDLETFIENIRPQTVCCLTDPEDHSEYEIIEIRNNTTLATEDLEKNFENKEDTWTEYMNFISESLNKGYKLSYAPKKVINELENKNRNI